MGFNIGDRVQSTTSGEYGTVQSSYRSSYSVGADPAMVICDVLKDGYVTVSPISESCLRLADSYVTPIRDTSAPPPKEERVVDPTTGGEKGQKAERFDLLPWDALEEVARVYAFGAKKYADRNWEKGYKWGLSLGALFRHTSRWACGEDRDPESGLHHLAHACFHCLGLVAFALRRKGTDDRATFTG